MLSIEQPYKPRKPYRTIQQLRADLDAYSEKLARLQKLKGGIPDPILFQFLAHIDLLRSEIDERMSARYPKFGL